DLKLRGPGDFLGTKQSGLPDFKFADILRDEGLLEVARKEAQRLLSEDPKLEQKEHQPLKKYLHRYLSERKDFYHMM
ncbi:MAG: ATP-dependent DNA helicase RecG, partial [Cyclonatronaceae bacterium]